MKRLKNVSGFFLALLVGLCVLSTPAMAEFPWVGDAPMLGKEEGDPPPGPGGGSSAKSEPVDSVKALGYSSLLVEISYRLAEFMVGDVDALPTTQSSPVGAKKASTKVD